MRRSLAPFILIALMLTMPWSSVTESSSQSAIESPLWTAAEAAENWYESQGSPGPSVEISAGAGILWVQTGSFDPLHEATDVPTHLEASEDPFATGYLIMQLHLNDGMLAEKLAGGVDAIVVDTLPEDAWVLRLPSSTQARSDAIIQLADDERVRWVGAQQPAWRLDAELHNAVGKVNLDITLALDVDTSTMEEHLYMTGAEFVRCDIYLCQVIGLDAIWLPSLSRDHRLLFVEPHDSIGIVNNYARSISTIDATVNNHNGGLDGTGEVGALSDSGLDQDHGDFNNRIRGVYHNYGPDNSAADANSGHGTHVAGTMFGDGSGDSSTRGVAPAATFHFYQLEHDPSGQLARWGSLYDMFRDSQQKNAHVQSNSWGAQSSWGQYTSDSRSADSFLNDYDDFLVLFAAGNEGSQGAQSIAPPATAKNVLTVGASTTGRPGTASAGQVASFSSVGPTADGRIKPDIVAPGVQICSPRAEEAQNPAGWSCSSARHSGTTIPLYMSADGTSSATPVVGGAALLARQFLRTELSISNPDSALIKAILINGARDIGTANVPNMDEGWGQLDLEESLYPYNGVIAKNIFFDTSQTLSPGLSYSYNYAIDGSYGIDVTLVWNDLEGSSSATQSASRLVNDLDLTVTSPDGVTYKGNDFANGFSTTGGSKDSLNNVERIRLASGPVGDWTITVGHSGGSQQGYALVISAVGNENPISDIAVFDGSIWASQLTPLENDYVLLRMAWVNQAPAMTGSYEVMVEDVTDGEVIWSGTRDPLAGGASDSFSFQRQFTSTGIHTIRLTLDSTNNVTEMNDEVDGTNNNVMELDLNITAIGVRITPHMPDGSMPADSDEVEIARKQILDPSTGVDVSWDLTLANEGTSDEEIVLVVTPVQMLEANGALQPTEDEWEKSTSEEGPFSLTSQGGVADSTEVTVTMRDLDADLDAFNGARYALPGTYVVDVIAYYRMNPTVSHTIRLEVEVLRVEGLETILAGTNDLGAVPGDFASFSLSVLNTGNGETAYQISCETPNRWAIEVGSGNSSTITLEPLARLQFIPVPVRVRVPYIVDGLPSAGTVESVTCVTTAMNPDTNQLNPSITTTESPANGVEVWVSRDFSADLYDGNDDPLGPSGFIESISVENEQEISHTLVVENRGNIEIDFSVRASPAMPQWDLEMVAGTLSDDRFLQFTLQPGTSLNIDITVRVPYNANDGDVNQIEFRTELVGAGFQENRTRLVVQEIADISLQLPESGEISATIGDYGLAEISLENIGNVDLLLDWSFGTLPDGWQIGFASTTPGGIAKGSSTTVTVSLLVAPGTAPGPGETLSVIIEAETLDGDKQFQKIAELGIVVLPSLWVTFETESRVEIPQGSPTSGNLTVTNSGNIACDVLLEVSAPDGLDVTLSKETLEMMTVGETRIVPYTLNSASLRGLQVVTFSGTPIGLSGESVASGNESAMLDVTVTGDGEADGIAGVLESLGLPQWTIAIFALLIVALLGFGILSLRRANRGGIDSGTPSSGDILVAQEVRREAALNIGVTEEDQMSGAVSADELAAALAQSQPKLALPPLPGMQTATPAGLPPGLPPTPAPVPEGLPPEPSSAGPPLPPGGLPPGWTMEQWEHYGQEYLQRIGQS
ncbi:MAG: S8 family serine peptidase [Candidatus Thermoplasmatota archaeon]|nr:S8 family serine peptidase [Candidatus Thermoplasmatota archaeon]MEE2758882.1 S8 family serine peptidase [Candidatus Thermoplasmatota archaeon]